MRGVGHRHERAVRCDGREWRDRRTRLTRTAKSCGPDAAVLALSFTGYLVERRWQESRSPGRARSKPYSHCAGKAGVFPLPCMLVCAFLGANCTRDRGCSSTRSSLRPLIPKRANEDANLGRNAPRECETISTVIASAAKQSISPQKKVSMDCFVASAGDYSGLDWTLPGLA